MAGKYIGKEVYFPTEYGLSAIGGLKSDIRRKEEKIGALKSIAEWRKGKGWKLLGRTWSEFRGKEGEGTQKMVARGSEGGGRENRFLDALDEKAKLASDLCRVGGEEEIR